MIVEALQEFYEETSEASKNSRHCWKEGERTVIRASATGDCLRALWYDLNGYDRLPTSADVIRAQQEGQAFEHHMRETLLAKGVDLRDKQREVETDAGEFIVRGHIDNNLYVGGEPKAVVDFKKEAHLFGVNLWEKHRPQVSAYCAGTGLPIAVVLTEGKREGYKPHRYYTARRKNPTRTEAIKEIVFKYSRFYFDELIRQLAVIKYLKPDPLPPEATENGWEIYGWKCYYCPFSKACRAGSVVVKYGTRFTLAKRV